MKRDAVLVEDVASVAPDRKSTNSRRPKVTVTFAGGAVAELDVSDAREKVWAEVLESTRAARKPAYVELNPKTRRITTLLLPGEYGIVDIREASRGGDIEIEFAESHAIHYLRREGERFAELRELLEKAMRARQRVLVTDSLDGTAIIDARTLT